VNLSFYIAKRYLFSKKSLNAINIISGISVLGVFVGSAALVIILSVFNGFEDMVLSMYNTFTPEIRIEPSKGKTFNPREKYFDNLKKDSRISNYVEVLQEKALLQYNNAQYIGLVKGVSDDFVKGKKLDSIVVDGTFTLKSDSINYAVMGADVQNTLSVDIRDHFSNLEIYSPQKSAGNSLTPSDQFVLKSIHVSGIFQLQQQFDQMVFVPIDFARELMSEDKNVSAIELTLKPGKSVNSIRNEISDKLGKEFIVKDRMQQNQLLYKILNTEKIAVFFILTFVLIIAIFNILGSLTMLVMDKRKDIAVLNSMGSDESLIRGIFFIEGIMISMTGCIIGILAGLIFCIVQQQYGYIKMNINFQTEAYPVTFQWSDLLVIFATVSLISVIASSVASRLSIKNAIDLKANL
jgi:lipoprotein-releasing system permease protein